MEANTATNRQRYALFCITKKDYRTVVISKEEASKLISEAQQQSGYQRKPKNDLLHFLESKVDVLVQSITKEFQISSTISDDPMTTKKPKSYLFLGGGCGFSFIEFDKRSKKAKSIVEEAGKLRDKINQMVVSCIDKNYLKKLEASGNPIQAHLAQNLYYKSSYDSLVVQYMDEQGIKGAWVRTMYD